LAVLSAGEEQALGQGWLGQTPAAFRQSVLERAVRRDFGTNEALHFAGDDAGGMYGILTGSVRATIAADEHGPYFFHLLRPGTWVGEGPSIVGQARPVTLSASRATSLLYLQQRAIQEITQKDPAYWRYFVMPLMGHLNVAMGAVTDLMIRDPVRRLAAVMLRLGGCRFAASPPVAALEIDANQEDIAIMANLSRTTTGSVLRTWEADGLIELAYGRLIIHAPDRLRHLLAE